MEGKIIFITGATAGFGEATAYKFAEEGWNIIINGRRGERLHSIEADLRKKFNANVLSLQFDVRHYDEVKKAIESIPAEWKTIDVLVNNAGLASGLAPIQEGDLEDWEKMIDTNIKGLLYVSRLILPSMVERKSGHVINVASIAGKDVYIKGNVYCATKFAVDALSKAMREDLLEHHVKVTNVAPGLAETEFSLVRFHGDKNRAAKTYEGLQALKGEDVADVIYFVATRPHHVVINDIVLTPLAQANPFYIVKE